MIAAYKKMLGANKEKQQERYKFKSYENKKHNESATDLEGNTNEDGTTKKPSLLILLKMVGLKIAKNPNSYACISGLACALVSNGWHVKMPKIVEGSVQILSKAGARNAMFCMEDNRLWCGLNCIRDVTEKIIDCGAALTALGMLLRFVAAPVTMAVSSLIVGLRVLEYDSR
nr:auxin efflux carrier component 5-like [Tanacetum cinerariifolium]